MNLSLDNNVNKLVLLLIVGVIALLLINMNEKQLGKQVAIVLSIVVIVVCGYFGYVLLNSPEENFVNPNESFSPIYDKDNHEHFYQENGEEEETEEERVLREDAEVAAAEQAAYQNQVQENVRAAQGNNSVEGVNASKGQVVPQELAANNSGSNVLDCKALLPGDTDSTWAANSPNNKGGISTGNLLNAGHHVGVNTTGCSMRNSNRGLRSEPPNPQVQVSPWLQTTICPDLYRKPLE